MLVRILKLITLGLWSFTLLTGIFTFLIIDFYLVQRWAEKQEMEKSEIVKKKRYEFDHMDYAGKGLQYEFQDGKFKLIKIANTELKGVK